MSSQRKAMNDRIDRMAAMAKRTAAKVADATDRAAAVATAQVHDAGKQLKQAGEKVIKKTGQR